VKRKALVVDNHPVILKFMSSLLQKEGYQVRTAEDGISALDILQIYLPDIIFLVYLYGLFTTSGFKHIITHLFDQLSAHIQYHLLIIYH